MNVVKAHEFEAWVEATTLPAAVADEVHAAVKALVE